jgi:TPR repeat protein
MNNLAGLYHFGKGVAQDDTKAREWCGKAAALGDTTAMHLLGFLHDRGLGGKRDGKEAARLIEGALRKGDEDSLKQMRSYATDWTIDFRIAMQSRLKDAGVYNGQVDGQFGPDSLRALDAIFGTEKIGGQPLR